MSFRGAVGSPFDDGGGKICDGILCVEIDSVWAEYYCWIRGTRFQAFKSAAAEQKSSPASSHGDLMIQFSIGQNKSHARAIELSPGSSPKLGPAASFLPPSPRFIEVNLLREQKRIVIAFKDERERNYWMSLINGTPASRLAGGASNVQSGTTTKSASEENEIRALSADATTSEDDEGDTDIYCCSSVSFLKLKVDTFVRLIKVILAFPFVIIIASLNLSPKYVSMIPTWAMRIMNLLIYVVPVVYVNALLAQTNSESLQRLILGVYLAIYLIPVAYVVIQKITVSQSTSRIEEGTFCFRPARDMRWTYSNVFAISGFLLEWLQHCLYCFPLGIVQKQSAQTVQNSPPYVPYIYYFWISVASVFICAVILILNAVLKGKKHYNFQRFGLAWLFLYTVGGPGFVTVVTILFMSLWCDYTGDIPVLMQDRTVVCWDPYHTRMAVCGLVSLAIFLIQMTLLPSGTYKETMRNNELDVMFVPVYLQGHYVLKAIFCGIYVTFYNDDWVRVVLLTFINLLLLGLMCWMQPCSVQIINTIRQTFFLCAVISGFQSLIYVANTKILDNADTYPIKALFMTTLATNCLIICIGMGLYHLYTTRSTKFQIARTFLDLEWQVSKGGAVHPRVLEPLIALTLSTERGDEELAKNYIGQLVWLISYPNMRVQFQSAWGIANLALVDEDARRKIHEAGGTKALFEWFNDMHPVVQLEALAAMANLTLSYQVTLEMVSVYGCIPLFINLVSTSKIAKLAQFASIALGNIARTEAHRALILSSGGVPMLAGLLISSEYATRQYACLALANIALSPSLEILEAFRSKRLLDKLVKMATRKEPETQREVTALLRNLSCHESLRPMLVSRNAMSAVAAASHSVYPEVKEWAAQMEKLLLPYGVAQPDVNGSTELPVYFSNPSASSSSSSPTSKRTMGGIFAKLKPHQAAAATLLDPAAMSMLSTVELLSKMSPLEGCVTWSTWGSKLDSIFSPIFSTLPSIQVCIPIHYECLLIFLSLSKYA
jgi:hypothetical protein